MLSPVLGHVYLHYGLDRWFERVVKARLWGKAILLRYYDDFIMGFERREDAERVMGVLGKRLGRFGLTLHPDKTRLLDFRRPAAHQRAGQGRATFDFLGFTYYGTNPDGAVDMEEPDGGNLPDRPRVHLARGLVLSP